ncbi:hypothetical protein EJ08DRAFT_665002 [Tothia fuscella]|uniref:BTB domain-containing protein n=1 Tax=Tothia fuscella TaxID=1048955 RepID=A0A9P4NI38_9PEZI|nr:hypothetical protein EJ08DRAFT_665002 [Tothia fuscella]
MASELADAHVAGLAKLLKLEAHSDLVITCPDGTKFNVHKAIMCSQSEFFAKACREGAFREGIDGVVSVESEAQHVRAMVQFCYTMGYDTTTNTDNMLFHAHMYALADFYATPSLKILAKKKLLERKPLLDSTYAEAVIVIYTTTPETDRGLRNVMTSIFRTKELLIPLVKDLLGMSSIEKPQDLQKDLNEALDGLLVKDNWHTCTCHGCGHSWQEHNPGASRFHCPVCTSDDCV